MIKISAVIITYNEERNIVRCLQSLEGIADEIVVVDSFSTDETKNLCKPFKVKFLQNPFEGYRQQKAWACNQALFDYILSLDADEEVSEELKKSLINVKKDWNADGYSFNRLTNYLGKWIRHCGWYPDAKLRLFDRRKGAWSGVNIHESVEMNENATVGKLKGDLLHYSYYSIHQHIDQFNRFTDISAQEALVKGKKSNLFIAVFKGIWKFKRDYFFKLGFLDGYYGFIICSLGGFATYSKYLKIRELNKKQKPG